MPNYLMHLFFSGNDEAVMVGNFIADGVKGKRVNEYPERVAAGIKLHRSMDDFTDRHESVAESKTKFRPLYGKYAGVAIDIIYDHFLAADFSMYSAMNLDDFASFCYRTFLKNWQIMPWDVKLFLPFLIRHKRLQSYARLSGLSESLRIMGKRTSFPQKTDEAILLLKANYDCLYREFCTYFNDLQLHVSTIKKEYSIN